ncbi:MAG: hypothetical protein RL119_1634, partial [Actinomycetota bacterium]
MQGVVHGHSGVDMGWLEENFVTNLWLLAGVG